MVIGVVFATPTDPGHTPSPDQEPKMSHLLFSRKDKYPYAGNCAGNDKWLFSRCQCTSYVAWRVNVAHKDLNFDNYYRSVHWGDAKNWDSASRKAKVKVSKAPVVGAIAQTDDGAGHVAYVVRVSKDRKKVDVEEYHYARKNRYGKRTGLAATRFRYIHL